MLDRTADLGCDLEGTTEAVCSGYSSFNPAYFNGQVTTSTVTNWTSTLLGPEVEWGTLTLANVPPKTTGGGGEDSGSDASDASSVQTSNDFFYTPNPTGLAGGAPTPSGLLAALAGTLLGVALAL